MEMLRWCADVYVEADADLSDASELIARQANSRKPLPVISQPFTRALND